NIPEIITYRTNAVEAVLLIIGVARNQILEKQSKRFLHHVAGILDEIVIVVNELAETCQEAVGKRFVKQVVQNVLAVELVGIVEYFGKIGRHEAAHVVPQQAFPNGGATAFISQEIPQGIDMYRDLFPIVNAGIRSRSQNRRKAGF